jgi:hypothetical protein
VVGGLERFISRLAVFGDVVTDQKPTGGPRRDISEEWDAGMRTGKELQGLPPGALSSIIIDRIN